jgi:hypothetical protein
MPRPGAAAARILVLPLEYDQVDTALSSPFDDPQSRLGRALVMASFISWLAADLTARRTTYLALAQTYSRTLTDAGQNSRTAAALAETWIGWVAITDFLLERDAITPEEQTQTRVRVDAALHDAAHATRMPDKPHATTGS